ncbi:hypothetical protein MJL33_29355, partial [Salmonella enterica subsp. enterica serovar Kentucky]|nr:hypothetical protein [Salmonella enterica subsp. enterica serovar Kentucky]
KLPFTYAKDGISYTFSIVPAALGKEDAVRKTNLVGLLDGYFHFEALGTGNVTDNATLELSTGGDFANNIGGTGSVVKSGDETLTL